MGACFGSEAYEDMYGPIRDDAAPDKPASDMFGSLLTMMTPTVFGSKFTDLACKVLTAPQRQFYSISELGPVRFDCDGLSMTREDVVLKNRRGVRIHGSYWSTAREWKTGATYLEPRPCVLYVHGAGSSRVEAAGQPLRCAIAVGASLLAIDTTAAGHSDGDRVSLGGAFEVADVACAVAWLKADAKVKDVVLWGRSAGAVACLGYAAEAEASDGPGPRVKGVLADSAFSDLGVICEDMFDKKASGVPRVMRSAVASAAYAEVKRVAGWDPRENRAAATVAAIRKTPCLFAAALDDDLVDKKHAAVLEKNCACPHKMRFERASRPPSFFFRLETVLLGSRAATTRRGPRSSSSAPRPSSTSGSASTGRPSAATSATTPRRSRRRRRRPSRRGPSSRRSRTGAGPRPRGPRPRRRRPTAASRRPTRTAGRPRRA